MLIRITPALPDDAKRLAEMVGELLREIMAAIGDRVFEFDRAATETRAGDWLGESTYTVFLAHADEHALIGFLALAETRALYAGGAFGIIPELYVRPAFRSQGVGAQLLTAAKQWAASRHWVRLEVTTPPLPQFDRALAFYQRHGFRISGGRKMKVDL